MSVRDELADSLATAAHALAGLLGADLALILAERAEQAADRLAANLGDPDPAVAAQTATDVVTALWTGDPPPEWWATELGQALAAAGTDEPVSHATAAAMLGVTRGTVTQLAARGTLDHHPDGGGLSRASVLRYARERRRR